MILPKKCDILIMSPRSSMVELLICNQRVGGSNPSVGSIYFQAFESRRGSGNRNKVFEREK